MNQQQAQTEAERRWGPNAGTFDRSLFPHDYLLQDASKRVGCYWVGLDSFTYGNGNTWEEAFANVTSGRAIA